MIGTDKHADLVAAFYKRLLDQDVAADVAGVLTIDLNKAVVAGAVEVPGETPDRDARAAAAEAKRAKRREELAQMQEGS